LPPFLLFERRITMVLVPETRFEAFLAKIAGEEGPDLEPITRTEAFLDDIAGAGHDLEPRTRIEYWLQKIAENAGGGGGGIPSGYSELEYLQSDGESYINLGYYPNPETILRIDYQSLKQADSEFQAIFGATSGAVSSVVAPAFFAYLASNNTLNVSSNKSGGAAANFADAWNYESRKTLVMSNYLTSIGSTARVPQSGSGGPLEASMEYPLYLFCRNHGNELMRAPAVGRVYRLQIMDNAATHDYVPVIRDSDNVRGLIDTYSGTFYTNAGTGTFTGPRRS
jgi:hypothetical protein